MKEGCLTDYYRIGDKIISRKKISAGIEKILTERSKGKSQQEVADAMGVDRTFISKLESLGELRKGKNIAVVGFPVKNKEELRQIFLDRGITNILLMNEKERTAFVESKTGLTLVNELIRLIKEYRKYDTVIVLASDMRTKWIEGLLDKEVITVDIGTSPLKEDVYVEPESIIEILDQLI
ncbi:MAG TPA: transcriptional regulator [Candidatus Atribacteria bacterium]|nr:transcriptional regulator [Candidatus Atribacteria bacterium]